MGNTFEETLEWLLIEDHGVMAKSKDGEMVGYLFFASPIENLFGLRDGAYAPLGGTWVKPDLPSKDRKRIMTNLLSYQLDKLSQSDITSFAIDTFSKDKDITETLTFSGFGICKACSILEIKDAAPFTTDITSRTAINSQSAVSFSAGINSQSAASSSAGINSQSGPITISELEYSTENKEKIFTLIEELSLHLLKSPCFKVIDMAEYSRQFSEDYSDRTKRVFIAKQNEEIIAMLTLTKAGENHVSCAEDVINISDMFVKEEFRGTKIAQKLVAYVYDIAKDEGNKFLAVEHETTNLIAANFWSKYFTPYAFTFARKIDERIMKWH